MPKRYKLHGDEGMVQHIHTMACIPNDPANSDYQTYLGWVAEGNTPDPWMTQQELDDEAVVEATEVARKAAKAQAIIDNLPPWNQVQNRVDSIRSNAAAASTVSQLKIALAPLLDLIEGHLRVTYWDVKDQAD